MPALYRLFFLDELQTTICGYCGLYHKRGKILHEVQKYRDL